jgi:uncharacterized protein
MAILEFQDLSFIEEKDRVKVIFLDYYHFYIEKKDLESIAKYKINKNSIELDTSEKTANNKFNRILQIGFDNLTNSFGKKTIYVHRNSEIPLFGTNEFGVVDRNSTCIEVKPMTVCNLNCVYCSVDAGSKSKKSVDFVVEKDYLIQELEKITSMKKKPLEVNINPQGEPLMYKPLYELIKDIKALKGINLVTINTNGLLLSEKSIDKLSEVGLNRINLSLNSLDKTIADELSGEKYPLEKIKKLVKYCEGKVDILIAPVIVPGINEDDMSALVNFAKENKIKIGFQNFLHYSKGRNPGKQTSMDDFMEKLKVLQKELDYTLIHDAKDFFIEEDTKIAKPFKKNMVVKARIVSLGKFDNERIAAASNRCITIHCIEPINKEVHVKIVRDKHNIFKGTLTKK